MTKQEFINGLPSSFGENIKVNYYRAYFSNLFHDNKRVYMGDRYNAEQLLDDIKDYYEEEISEGYEPDDIFIQVGHVEKNVDGKCLWETMDDSVTYYVIYKGELLVEIV